jgi:hypothetical protein
MSHLQIIGATEYPQVRALIDVSVSTANLPDDVIEAPVYGGAAELWALSTAGSLAGWPAVALDRLKMAVTFRLAGMLLPAMPNLTQEQKGERAGYQRLPINIERRVGELNAAASDHLQAAIELAEVEVTEIVEAPVFTLARGRRRWG